MKLTKNQLQTQARDLGLSTDGTAAQIQRRIDAYLEACHDTAAALESDPYDEEEEDEEPAKARPRDTAVGPFMLAGALFSGLFD
ncbi:MAG: hypothetical protein HC857_01130 [Synechococcales cyanobacterium RU_4_20]|nr:hypothetical protein [Synechococcales cyanobacterium RU_4_20]NJR71132.1 hypothetical protein [Synechococcales cyanobacterium CRU_2_2]